MGNITSWYRSSLLRKWLVYLFCEMTVVRYDPPIKTLFNYSWKGVPRKVSPNREEHDRNARLWTRQYARPADSDGMSPTHNENEEMKEPLNVCLIPFQTQKCIQVLNFPFSRMLRLLLRTQICKSVTSCMYSFIRYWYQHCHRKF